ncbi:acetoacetate metabolism regulatory protein AtoC [Thermaurantimonas aggregans]|uniref:Acetoacetate metabolism regulatory protein AtoC n=1 Tax=Thermaurantimonas aggregans TaxID=2173829 RepID=A0A401XMG9_9FLAO|nr:sigma-54 dependent transcriptional regulator [Thermaurantimonas aggregans]MCX8148407.1 sigma-54 dependent transcriptional regulator [Thermaurantimonas aggregans]GCD78210.1 acetoacetate metabolism regulatory protein AtoC [Thermaurantimonas aggregans]
MSAFKIFLVEDDEFYGKLLKHHLSLNPDYEVELFTSGRELLENLYKKPNVISLDYTLPDMSGANVLRDIKKQYPEIPVIIVSGQEDITTAVTLLKEGAYDYIVKDKDTKERIWNVVKHIRENAKLKDEIDRLREEVNQKYDFSNIKGNSPAIKRVFKLIEKASQSNITVSICGETGTGKELVAKAIHYNSARRKKPFVAVNIAAIPKDLIESELFGHEKGSFTGAINRRIGKFEEANGGTIFLDEIGEMELHLQAKLLRVLQEKEVTRIGSNTPVKIDARIISATHRNLQEEVKAGRFREDLYYRLIGLPIELPPLRERGNDILILAKHFADEFAKENKMEKVVFTPEAQEKLLRYHWPGNVRELKAIIELAVVMSDDGKITEENINFTNSNNNIQDLLHESGTLRDFTNKIIQYYLEKYDNNVLEVAKRLDIGKSTIYRLIKNKEIILK